MNVSLMKTIVIIFALIVLVQGCNAQSGEKIKADEKPVSLTASPLEEGASNAEVEKLIDEGTDFIIEGEYDLAINNFNKAIKLDSNFADSYNHRGAAYSNKGNLDSAITDFTKAIKLNPKFYVAYLNRATAYVAKKDFKSAIADFTKIIELDPTTGMLYEFRADAYDKIGRKDLAVADRQKAKELKNTPK